jgi:hypothetical protein
MEPTLKWDKQALLRSTAFAPLHPVISCLEEDRFPTPQDCNTLLDIHQPCINVQSGKPLRFVPQDQGKLAFAAQYEPRCFLKGEVQTRENNWHDLLNALVWLTFPKSKAAINTRHYHALTEVKADEQLESGSQRGSVRDTSTLLDESGVIVPCADADLARLLRNFQWKELFWQRRAQVQTRMGFYLFGHGLYEKALRPYIGMTGQGLLLPVDIEFFAWPLPQRLNHLDDLLANYLSAQENCRDTRELSPVPLLGVPGWAVQNENAEYYDNTHYFRSGRHGHSAS